MRHALALLVVLLAGGPPLAAEPAAEDLRSWRSWAVGALDEPPGGIQAWPALAEQLHELVDQRRQDEAGLAPLQPDQGLQRAAAAHGIDMLRRDFMAHESPEGLGPGERTALLARRFIGTTGENLAEHTGLTLDQLETQLGPLTAKLVDGWMASPGHRENIVRPDFSHASIGAFVEGDRLVVVQVFGDVRALLAEPLPFAQEQGARLDLELAGDGPSPPPSNYAFRAPDQLVQDVVVLDLASDRIAVDPGLYQLMFLFPGEEENSFAVAGGPWIDVR